MPALSPERSKLRSQIANGTKLGRPTAELQQLRAAYAAETLAEHIARVVAAAPPLTAEQRDRLALLLRPNTGGTAA
jgi:hypothetical protein